jgi:NAD(P)-dependent dehydrogenase (short-subunit alcohol dehydrogenase family)
MSELRFDKRAVVVTGGGRGIGRSHALLLASRGAQVVVADYGAELDGSGSSSEPADEVVKEIEASGGEAVSCFASVAEEDGAAAIIDTAITSFGRIDAVVNNAGISDMHLFEDLSLEQFRRMLDVHYLGSMLVTRHAWPHFVEAGYGRIVNTTSEGILGAQKLLTSYGAAKGAVWAFTRNIAAEGIEYGILANAVCPRALTRMSQQGEKVKADHAPDPEVESILARMNPDLVAPAAAYLAHESCTLNGEVLVAGGGEVFRMTPVVTRGLSKDWITIEDVAENLDTIMSIDDAVIPPIGTYGR